jgi:hypothetical protein
MPSYSLPWPYLDPVMSDHCSPLSLLISMHQGAPGLSGWSFFSSVSTLSLGNLIQFHFFFLIFWFWDLGHNIHYLLTFSIIYLFIRFIIYYIYEQSLYCLPTRVI